MKIRDVRKSLIDRKGFAGNVESVEAMNEFKQELQSDFVLELIGNNKTASILIANNVVTDTASVTPLHRLATENIKNSSTYSSLMNKSAHQLKSLTGANITKNLQNDIYAKYGSQQIPAYDGQGNIKFIDLREDFESVKNDVQLYYKTDHHLTSAGAYEMYKLFAESKGLSVSTEYDVEIAEGFYGTAYSKGGFWLSEPDNIELWHNKNLKVKVEIIEPGKETVTSNSVFFKNQLENADKYPVFLDGNHSLVKLTNPDAKGGKLLIVKDSFAHCFTGFLAEKYSEIYMVDMRYYRTPLTDLVTENDIPEVLYLYGTDNLGTDTNSVWMQ